MTAKKPKAEDDSEDFLDTSPKRMAAARNNRLQLLMERIDRLEEEKKGVGEDIRDVYAEAKAVGYDTKIMRAIRKRMKMKPDDRAEFDALMETYAAELGVL